MRKPLYWAVLLFLAALFMFAGCEQSSAPQAEAEPDYNNDLMLAFDDELRLALDENTDTLKADGMFSLSWGKFKIPFLGSSFTTGHAMAVAFSGSQQRGYFQYGGIDMGTVNLSFAGDTLELNSMRGKRNNYVYLSLPNFKNRQRGQFKVFDFSMVPFLTNTTYTFSASGSDDFDAVNLSMQTPEAMLELTNITEGQSINPAEDLTVEWTGGKSGNTILLAVMPFHSFYGQKNKSANGKQWRKNFSNSNNADFIRLDYKNHPVIFKKLSVNDGTFTFTAAELTDLANSIEADALFLHIAAIDLVQETSGTRTLNKVIRMHDRVVLELQ